MIYPSFAVIAFGAAVTATGVISQDDALCGRVSAFVGQASGWNAQSDDSTIHLPSIFESQGRCGSSLSMSGVRSAHCSWSFSYRADAAKQAFEELSERIGKCAGSQPVKKASRGVNHPDSYDLRSIGFADGIVSIALKDKAALQETYVFLRVRAHP